MKTLNDLKTELTAQGYEYGIQDCKEGYFLITVTYTGQFGISGGYDIRSFSTTPLEHPSLASFIAFNVKF